MEMTQKSVFRLSPHAVAGVAQFGVYMGLFAMYYSLHAADGSNPEWRAYLMIALLAGLFCSVVPGLAVKNFGPLAYLGVFNTLCIYAVGLAAYSFYTWSLPGSDVILTSLALCYLLLAPIATSFVLFVKWMVTN